MGDRNVVALHWPVVCLLSDFDMVVSHKFELVLTEILTSFFYNMKNFFIMKSQMFQPAAMSAIWKSFYPVLAILCIGTLSAFVPGAAISEPTDMNETISSEAAIGGAYVVFAGKHGGNIKKSELRGQTELSVDGCAKGSRIFAFTLEVNRKGKVTKLHAKANVLTTDMVTTLNGLDAGDSFEFTSTKAYLPNGKDEVDVHCQKFVVV